MSLHHFGTDGIRAKNEIFTPEYLEKIALGIAALKSPITVTIGRDTRVSGLYMEEKLTEYLTKYGVNVIIFGMIPTPALAYLTQFFKADYGIMLSASHNPPEYNGIKLFNGNGEKVSETIEEAVEYVIDNGTDKKPKAKGKVIYEKGDDIYIDYVIDRVNPNLTGIKVLLDTANGATSIIAPRLFERAGAVVCHIKGETDGHNINEGCGATKIEFLEEQMRKGDYDIGFSYDGDGDRVKCVADGKVFDGDHIMYCHCQALKASGKLPHNAMVGTIMSNLGTEKACMAAGIKLIRVGVGDKFVFREMVDKGYAVGGEESGHMIFIDYLRTGDGMIASLLTAVLNKKTPLIDLDDIKVCPSVSDYVLCDASGVKKFVSNKEISYYLANINKEYRIVVRPSGTEPKIRILVEHENAQKAAEKATEIKKEIMAAIS